MLVFPELHQQKIHRAAGECFPIKSPLYWFLSWILFTTLCYKQRSDWLWFMVFRSKICNRFIQSGEIFKGLGLRRGWGRWHQWGALDKVMSWCPVPTVAEKPRNLWKFRLQVFQFLWPFFLINPWKPEMMNFFWEISLTMMIMGSQWLGLWVDPRHPRHDEQKHPCKKGCLLSRNHREFLRTTEFLWVQEEFTFPLVHHYTLHCQQGIHSLPCVDMTRFDVLLLFAGGTNPWNHAWNKKFEVW